MPDLSDLQRLGQEFDADGVTQEDREAAAAFATFTKARRDLEEAIMIGALDDNYIVQAFARHRIAAIAAARPMIETEAWQPIETAPKDQFILLYEDGAMRCGWWSEGRQEWEPAEIPILVDKAGNRIVSRELEQLRGERLELSGFLYEPTHWQPLPAPPAIRALGEN